MTGPAPRPTPAPGPGALAAIAARFGVAPADIRPMPQGEANHTVALGPDLVLRVPRDDGALLADLRRENAVLPVAAAAGLPVPGVVAWDETRATLPVPFMVMRRVPGTDLERAALPAGVAPPAWRAVGEAVARLHALPVGTFPAAALPLDLDDTDPAALLDPLVTAGALDAGTAAWVHDRYAVTAPHLPATVIPVPIHGDVAARNVLVDPGTGALTGLVDWGDAALADPAQDFAKLPPPHLLDVLAGYTGDDPGAIPGWQARALRYHLHWGVAAISGAVARSGRADGASLGRLLVVMRFLATTTNPRWDWLRRD